jgi:high-affinity nickel-transport protein
MIVGFRAMAMKHAEAAGNSTLVLGLGLVAANLAAWGWAWAAFHDSPAVLGTALLAWGLGLRHALDADHIAAIDGATRALMQEGQRPVAVGLFFALGHSSVVLVATLVAAVAASGAVGALEWVGEVGGVVGGAVSAAFLLAMAATLRGLWRDWRVARAGGAVAEAPVRRRRVVGLVRRGWHMMPLGFLFGLGFDTASAVMLLALSAAQMADGLPLSSVLVLPVLFACGMALVDTADGMVMVRAIDWALVSPVRRLGYNLALTGVAVAVALAVGLFQVWSLTGELAGWGLEAGRWDWFVDEHFDAIGAAVVALFLALWGAAALRARGRA